MVQKMWTGRHLGFDDAHVRGGARRNGLVDSPGAVGAPVSTRHGAMIFEVWLFLGHFFYFLEFVSCAPEKKKKREKIK